MTGEYFVTEKLLMLERQEKKNVGSKDWHVDGW